MSIVSKKESFQRVRSFCQDIADKTDCELQISRYRGKATYFEIIPAGSSYGARVRVSDTQSRDSDYMNYVLEGSDAILDEIKNIKESL